METVQIEFSTAEASTFYRDVILISINVLKEVDLFYSDRFASRYLK